MHSDKNTEFRTTRAAGFNPKEIFEIPRVVCTSGNSLFKELIASIVAKPSRRVSSCPVAIGKVKQSIMISDTSISQFFVKSVMSRLATFNFHSAVRAWPSSSIVKATTAAPWSLTKGIIRAKRESGPSPSS